MTVWERCRRLRGFRELLEADAGSCNGVWDSSFLECSSYHSCNRRSNTPRSGSAPRWPRSPPAGSPRAELLAVLPCKGTFAPAQKSSFQSPGYSLTSWNNLVSCSLAVVDRPCHPQSKQKHQLWLSYSRVNSQTGARKHPSLRMSLLNV